MQNAVKYMNDYRYNHYENKGELRLLRPEDTLEMFNESFKFIEEILYKEYPKLAESDNYFTFNRKKINRFKSFIENGLKNGDKVILHSNK